MLAQMDGRYGRGEFSENWTSEADFEESTAIIEALVAIEVKANSDVLSGLDNGLAQPDDAGKPDRRKSKARSSKIARRCSPTILAP